VTQVADGTRTDEHNPDVHYRDIDKGVSMNVNSGGIDRSLRLIVGLVLIGLTMNGSIGAWGWIGLVPVLTGTIGLCPLYSLLGINTSPLKKA
jgi:hypothetical protein